MKKEYVMKKFISFLMVLLVSLSIIGCAGSSSNMDDNQMTKDQPKNIDKNNVGITSGEDADQTDPTLIEGNLEKNDFKN